MWSADWGTGDTASFWGTLNLRLHPTPTTPESNSLTNS